MNNRSNVLLYPLLVLALLSLMYRFVGVFYEYTDNRPNELQRRNICLANLRQIYLSLRIYAESNEKWFPDRHLGQLWEEGILTAATVYVCPSVKRDHRLVNSADTAGTLGHYLYRPGLSKSIAPRKAVISDRYGNHHSGFVHVLFSDGTVMNIRVVNDLNAPRYTSPKYVNDVVLWDILDSVGDKLEYYSAQNVRNVMIDLHRQISQR